jgi:hypothetical protein
MRSPNQIPLKVTRPNQYRVSGLAELMRGAEDLEHLAGLRIREW